MQALPMELVVYITGFLDLEDIPRVIVVSSRFSNITDPNSNMSLLYSREQYHLRLLQLFFVECHHHFPENIHGLSLDSRLGNSFSSIDISLLDIFLVDQSMNTRSLRRLLDLGYRPSRTPVNTLATFSAFSDLVNALNSISQIIAFRIVEDRLDPSKDELLWVALDTALRSKYSTKTLVYYTLVESLLINDNTALQDEDHIQKFPPIELGTLLFEPENVTLSSSTIAEVNLLLTMVSAGWSTSLAVYEEELDTIHIENLLSSITDMEGLYCILELCCYIKPFTSYHRCLELIFSRIAEHSIMPESILLFAIDNIRQGCFTEKPLSTQLGPFLTLCSRFGISRPRFLNEFVNAEKRNTAPRTLIETLVHTMGVW